MMIKSNIAIALAIILGTASASMAATKHPVHHPQAVVVHRAPNTAYQSFGFAAPAPGTTGWTASLGYNPYDPSQVRCIGGSCAPNWGQGSPY